MRKYKLKIIFSFVLIVGIVIYFSEFQKTNAANILVQSKFDIANPTTVTFDNSVTVGNLVIVAVTAFNNIIDEADISDNKGNTYTRIAELKETVFNENHVALFYTIVATGGTSFTVTSAATDDTVGLYEYSGIITTTPLDTSNTAVGTADNPTVSITRGTANDLIFAVMVDYSDEQAITAGTGYTILNTQ